MAYEIVHRESTATWSTETIGANNEFDSVEEAQAAIEALIALGDDWATGEYAVREVGGNLVLDTRRVAKPRTVITYELNGQHIEGWDETEYDEINLQAAAQNLTAYQPGDVLTARLMRLDDKERVVEEREESVTL